MLFSLSQIAKTHKCKGKDKVSLQNSVRLAVVTWYNFLMILDLNLKMLATLRCYSRKIKANRVQPTRACSFLWLLLAFKHTSLYLAQTNRFPHSRATRLLRLSTPWMSEFSSCPFVQQNTAISNDNRNKIETTFGSILKSSFVFEHKRAPKSSLIT